MRVEAGLAGERAKIIAVTTAGIENCILLRHGRQFRNRFEKRSGDAAIMQSPSRLDGSRCVARMLRPPLLRLEQIDIAATRDVERMSLGAEHSAVLANER